MVIVSDIDLVVPIRMLMFFPGRQTLGLTIWNGCCLAPLCHPLSSRQRASERANVAIGVFHCFWHEKLFPRVKLKISN